MEKISIRNGKIILPGTIVEGKDLLLSDGIIEGVADREQTRDGYHVIDAAGKYVSPGFVDIHVHGGGGSDFMDGTIDSFRRISVIHSRYGTTSMVPTTMSGSRQSMAQMLEVFEQAKSSAPGGADLLGVHLEGPYFAKNQVGAQDPKYIRDPDPEEYLSIINRYPSLLRWSVAPERPGAIEMGRKLREKGILAAIAHTDAIYEDVVEAVAAGYTLATHLYSGMSGVSRRQAFRYAGVIESALLLEEIDVELIADGVHLPAPLLKLVYKIKGPDKIALVTDAMRAAAMPEGPSILGHLTEGVSVVVEDGVAKMPDRSSFAGSVATTDRLVRTMVLLAGIPIVQAVQMASATPARIMGVQHRKGSLEKGKDADVILFDENIIVHTTLVKGKIVHQRI